MAVSETTAAPPNWVSFAQTAPYLRKATLAAAQEKVAALPAQTLARTQSLLQTLTGMCGEPGNLHKAGALLKTALPDLAPKNHESSGPHPHVAAASLAVDAVLHGLVFCLGQKVKNSRNPESAALDLLRAMKDLPISDGVARATLHIEAREAMGAALYLKLVEAHPELAH